MLSNFDNEMLVKLGIDTKKLDSALLFTREFGPKDQTHNFEHHIRVVKNAIDGLSLMDKSPKFNTDVVVACAIHDCVDHKYPDICKRNLNLIEEKFGRDIIEVITNMSWSKNKQIPDEYWNSVRETAQYADWIDAIDLQRCIDYNHEKDLKPYRENVIKHYHEKLKLIRDVLPEPFHTLASDHHQKLVKDFEKYVSDQ